MSYTIFELDDREKGVTNENYADYQYSDWMLVFFVIRIR
jgi:hypothetical protein